jgi:hypothetical protein
MGRSPPYPLTPPSPRAIRASKSGCKLRVPDCVKQLHSFTHLISIYPDSLTTNNLATNFIPFASLEMLSPSRALLTLITVLPPRTSLFLLGHLLLGKPSILVFLAKLFCCTYIIRDDQFAPELARRNGPALAPLQVVLAQKCEDGAWSWQATQAAALLSFPNPNHPTSVFGQRHSTMYLTTTSWQNKIG